MSLLIRICTALVLVAIVCVGFVALSQQASGDVPSGAGTPTPSPGISPTPFHGAQPYPTGDVTCDHAVNLDDVLDLLRRSAGLEVRPACSPHAPSAAFVQSAGSVSLRLTPHFAYVETGSEFTIALEADIGTGTLGAYRAFVSYDQRKITPVSCTVTCNLVWSDDTIALGNAYFPGLTGTVTLGSIEFEVVSGPGDVANLTLNADELFNEDANPITDCVSSGAEYRVRVDSSSSGTQVVPTPTASPTPSPVPTAIPTPPPPNPRPCDEWPPASLRCHEPLNPANALWVLYNIVYPGHGYPVCGPVGGK